MESITLRDVGTLPGDEKRSLEMLLQHPVERDQQVFIMTFRPGVVPDEEAQHRARKSLSRTLDAAQRHASARGVTAQEADAAVEEAMREIRPRRP